MLSLQPVNTPSAPYSKASGAQKSSDDKFEDVFNAPKKNGDSGDKSTSQRAKNDQDKAGAQASEKTTSKNDKTLEKSAANKANDTSASDGQVEQVQTDIIAGSDEAISGLEDVTSAFEQDLDDVLNEIDTIPAINAVDETQITSQFIEENAVDASENIEIDAKTLTELLAEKPTETQSLNEVEVAEDDVSDPALSALPMLQTAPVIMQATTKNVDALKSELPKNDTFISAEAKFHAALNQVQQQSASGGQTSGGQANGGEGQKSNPGADIVKLTDSTGVNMDGVEVLETKTFSAPAMPLTANTNATNIADKIINLRELPAALQAQDTDPIYQTGQPKVLNTLKIQLAPANLGMVTVDLKLQGDELQVQLRVDNMDAYRQLTDDSSVIAKALRGQGFGIEQINIQLSLNDRGSSQQGQQQGQQSGQQQFNQQANSQTGSDQSSNFGQKDGQSQTSGYPGAEENDIGSTEADQAQNNNAADGVYI